MDTHVGLVLRGNRGININTMPVTNKRGRPLKFKSVLELQVKINAYFAECDPHTVEVTEWLQARDASGQLKKDKHGLNYLVQVTHMITTKQQPYTITGLAMALGTSRHILIDYEGKTDFLHTINDAKLKCQHYAEEYLYTGKNTVGAIFNLKNNYGWKDQIQQDNTGEIVHKWEDMTDEQLDAAIQAQKDRAA